MRCRRRDLCVIVVAAAVVVAGARAARAGTLRGIESRVFAVLNGLDDRAFVPAWTVMQLGSLGGAITTGAAVAAAGQLRLGRRIAVVGALTWLGSKAVKPFVGRGRPATEVDVARVLGSEQAGLGYPSGHAYGGALLNRVLPGRPADRQMSPRFLADGHTVLIAAFGGAVYTMDTRLEHWIEVACTIAGRSLTAEEWSDAFDDRPYRATCPPQGQA